MWNKIKIILKKLCNWRFAVCFGIAWMITNGWCYVFIVLGNLLNIGWMTAIGTGYLAFLWMPFTIEKLLTIPIAIFLLKILFPKETKIKEELEEELTKLKEEQNEKRKRKKQD